MFLPSHSIYLVKKDGTRVNVSMSDCSTKKEVREEVKEIIENYYDDQIGNYAKAQYVDRNDNILYECSIEECLNEQ